MAIGLFLARQFLFDLQLDGQAMAVPAGAVRSIQSVQAAGTHDDILECFVDRMAHVQGAVGVGRTVVEQKPLPPLAQLPQLAVQVHFLPAFETLRFALGKVAPHRERCLRQV